MPVTSTDVEDAESEEEDDTIDDTDVTEEEADVEAADVNICIAIFNHEYLVIWYRIRSPPGGERERLQRVPTERGGRRGDDPPTAVPLRERYQLWSVAASHHWSSTDRTTSTRR